MGGILIEEKHPPNFLCPVFPHMTVAETGGALVEVWDGIITFQSKGRSPRPRMMHCSQDAHPLRRSWTPRSPSVSASSFDLDCLPAVSHIAILSTIRSCRCFQCFSLYPSVCVHICAHIPRISLMFSDDKVWTLSQPLRWSCHLSYFIFSSLSTRWSEDLFLKPPSLIIQLLKVRSY